MADLPTKALSIRQPWAWAILHAGKDVENRARRFHYRGPICIHASKGVASIEYMESRREILAITGSRAHPPKLADDFPRGGIIGTAEIVDCVEASDSQWFFGPYGLLLRNVQPVDFIPVRGALGLFDWQKKLELTNREADP